jgi:hypothetical protein
MQFVCASMKLRQIFYTQIELRTFHTVWVKSCPQAALATSPLTSQHRTVGDRAAACRFRANKRHVDWLIRSRKPNTRECLVPVACGSIKT